MGLYNKITSYLGLMHGNFVSLFSPRIIDYQVYLYIICIKKIRLKNFFWVTNESIVTFTIYYYYYLIYF